MNMEKETSLWMGLSIFIKWKLGIRKSAKHKFEGRNCGKWIFGDQKVWKVVMGVICL